MYPKRAKRVHIGVAAICDPPLKNMPELCETFFVNLGNNAALGGVICSQ